MSMKTLLTQSTRKCKTNNNTRERTKNVNGKTEQIATKTRLTINFLGGRILINQQNRSMQMTKRANGTPCLAATVRALNPLII